MMEKVYFPRLTSSHMYAVRNAMEDYVKYVEESDLFNHEDLSDAKEAESILIHARPYEEDARDKNLFGKIAVIVIALMIAAEMLMVSYFGGVIYAIKHSAITYHAGEVRFKLFGKEYLRIVEGWIDYPC